MYTCIYCNYQEQMYLDACPQCGAEGNDERQIWLDEEDVRVRDQIKKEFDASSTKNNPYMSEKYKAYHGIVDKKE